MGPNAVSAPRKMMYDVTPPYADALPSVAAKPAIRPMAETAAESKPTMFAVQPHPAEVGLPDYRGKPAAISPEPVKQTLNQAYSHKQKTNWAVIVLAVAVSSILLVTGYLMLKMSA